MENEIKITLSRDELLTVIEGLKSLENDPIAKELGMTDEFYKLKDKLISLK